MAYEPPCYEKLLVATSELKNNFHRYAGHYLRPETSVLLKNIKHLKTTYCQKITTKSNWFLTPSPDPTRLNQIAFIQTLHNDLDSYLKSTNREKRQQAERILLGAVFYRYLRLKAFYELPLIKSSVQSR